MTIRPKAAPDLQRAIRRVTFACAALAPGASGAAIQEWQPARGDEPGLGDLAMGLAAGGSGLSALLMLAALLAALLVGLQLLSSRS